MQDMRHLNLFGKVTQISTRHCLRYNEFLIFCVPKPLISRAIGEHGRNVKKLYDILGKKVKIIPAPRGIEDAREFLLAVINPNSFKEIDVGEKEIVITAGPQNKAALIGRNKRRLLELQKISSDFFGKDLRIV